MRVAAIGQNMKIKITTKKLVKTGNSQRIDYKD